jgi:hypothetical protein
MATVTKDNKKTVTRAQAERALAAGADPIKFKNHPNYHVRQKAWRKDGRHLGTDPVEAKRFLDSIKMKLPKEEWASRFPLTEDEILKLESATTESEWNDLCDAVKELRNGTYPSNWYELVIQSGLSGQKAAAFREAFREAIPKEVFEEQVALSNETINEVIAEEKTEVPS